MWDPEPASARRGPGRPTGDGGTRDAILDAARALFGARGYDGASLRAIAGEAGVDPAMIRHFFADKRGLFAATIDDRTMIVQRLVGAYAGPREGAGRRLAETYLGLWEDEQAGPMLRAVARTALTSEESAAMMREIIADRILGSFGGPPDPESALRVGIVGSHLLGVAAARYLVRVQPVAEVEREVLVDILAPVLDAYLTGPLGS